MDRDPVDIEDAPAPPATDPIPLEDAPSSDTQPAGDPPADAVTEP